MAEVFKNSIDEKPVKETELESSLYELDPTDTPVDTIDQQDREVNPQTKENYKKLQDRVLTLQEMEYLASKINWQKVTIDGKDLTIKCNVMNNGNDFISLVIGDKNLWKTLSIVQNLWWNKDENGNIVELTSVFYEYKDPDHPLQKDPIHYEEWGQHTFYDYKWEDKVKLNEDNSKFFQGMFNAVVDKISKLDTQK